MNNDNDDKLKTAIDWLIKELPPTKYGSVGITLYVHDGKIVKIGKEKEEKIQ